MVKKSLFVVFLLVFLIGFTSAETYLIYEEDYDNTIESGRECTEDTVFTTGTYQKAICEDKNYCTIEYNDPECVGGFERQTTKEKSCVPCKYGCYDYGCFNNKVVCDDLINCRMYADEVFVIDDLTFGINRMTTSSSWFNFNRNNHVQSIQKDKGERQKLYTGDNYIYYITIGDISDDYIEFDLEKENIVEKSSVKCTETDGGKDPYNYGELIVGVTIVDGCSDAKNLYEVYCDPNSDLGFSDTIYECVNGCVEGACVKQEVAREKYFEEKNTYDDSEEKSLVKVEDIWGNEVPSGCLRWYDGCNSCFVDYESLYGEGVVLGCTERACLKNEIKDHYCMEYISDEGDKDCSGCGIEGQCFPFGHRKDGRFCSDSENFLNYSMAGEICENSFECDSNICVSGQCVDGGLIDRIINWFKKFFGEE